MKFVMITVVLLAILTGIYDVEFEKTLLISLVLTLIAYVLGDLMVFRKTGNGASTNHAGNNHSGDHERHEDHKNETSWQRLPISAFLS